MSGERTIETRVPARLDRLPWSRWHTLVIFALGVTWVLDGIEVSIVGNIADALTNPETGPGFTAGPVGAATGVHIPRGCPGGGVFSYPTDPLRRGGLFLVSTARSQGGR